MAEQKQEIYLNNQKEIISTATENREGEVKTDQKKTKENFLLSQRNELSHKEVDVSSQSKSQAAIRKVRRPYECDMCDARFSDMHCLKTHLTAHTGEKPNKCDICGVRFSSMKTLKFHLQRHVIEKRSTDQYRKEDQEKAGKQEVESNYISSQCDYCEVRFTQKSLKEMHMRIHTGEKPFDCNICKKTFNVRHNLMRHLRTHTRETPYKCDIFQKTFSHLSTLHKHIRLHTGEKPFKCDMCESAFSRKDSLNLHLKTHTEETPYKCDICEVRFKSQKGMNGHYKRKHNH